MTASVREFESYDRLLDGTQAASFRYFLHEFNPTNGLVRDKTRENWPASIAAVGLALAAYPVGVERGLVPREVAAQRTLATLRFFHNSPQNSSSCATGYHGFYYHFLDMETGARVWNCELSSIDTAILVAGMLTCAAYFQRTEENEDEIRCLADALYRRVDWNWMLAGAPTVCHGWKPETGFLKWHWEGYDEALILYLLGLGSPTFPLAPENYDAWASTYEWKSVYDVDFLYAGPLFTHQMSHVWVDFRGIRDAFMQARKFDYFENSRHATLIQQQYGIRNPLGFAEYGPLCWGVTASAGPGNQSRKVRGVDRVFYDYMARGAPYGPDDGTISPWAVVASLPFAPEIVLPTTEHFHRLRLHELNPYGFKASFNPTFAVDPPTKVGWVSHYHFGINEGPTVIMIENFRSELVWSLMRTCPYLVAGLRRAGFKGGWLE